MLNNKIKFMNYVGGYLRPFKNFSMHITNLYALAIESLSVASTVMSKISRIRKDATYNLKIATYVKSTVGQYSFHVTKNAISRA